MPYLDQDTKQRIDNDFAGGLVRAPATVGELTYYMQSAICQFLEGRLDDNAELRYVDLAEVLGAIGGARADFIDRVLIPYERGARKRNGDAWPNGILRAVGGAVR